MDIPDFLDRIAAAVGGVEELATSDNLAAHRYDPAEGGCATCRLYEGEYDMSRDTDAVRAAPWPCAVVRLARLVDGYRDPDEDPDPMRYHPSDDDFPRIVALGVHLGVHIVPAEDDHDVVKRVVYALDRLDMRLVDWDPDD